MARKGAWIVIVCSFLAHFVFSNTSYNLVQIQTRDLIVGLMASHGVAYLFYPLIGLLADVWFTKYKVIFASAVVQIVTSGMAVVFAVAWITVLYTYTSAHHLLVVEDGVTITGLLFVVGMMVGIGMFEANAIQFGMDQLQEEPSSQISTFIHWYYWSTCVGVALISLPITGFLSIGMYTNCMIDFRVQEKDKFGALRHLSVPIAIVGPLVQFVLAITSLMILFRCKKHLTIEPAGYNPFTTVYKVLKYAWQHKCPENRSAFTYWEEDIPRRIDLGKNKYGGPFTTEEVEDTKSFFRIMLLLFSLFGFHLSGNGFSVTRQLMHKLCPSSWVLLLLITSPPVLDTLTALVFIVMLQFVLLPYFHRFVPSLFKRLGIGLMLLFMQELAGILIAWKARENNFEHCYSSNHSVPDVSNCFKSRVMFIVNGTCRAINGHYHHHCEGDSVSLVFIWILIPQFLRSLSYLLVFMTALEFICAQAPLRMKGLLVGIWYATFSLRCLVVNFTEMYIVDHIVWLILHGVRGLLILVSVLLYFCVARRYHYRQRDEVVNERFLVEEVYERQLLQAEQYEREKKQNRTSCSLQNTVSYGAIHKQEH